jgi:hypothetical protein
MNPGTTVGAEPPVPGEKPRGSGGPLSAGCLGWIIVLPGFVVSLIYFGYKLFNNDVGYIESRSRLWSV